MNSSNIMINQELWESLPDDLKSIVESAAMNQAARWYFVHEIESRKVLESMQSEYDVEMITLPSSEVEKIRSAGLESLRELGDSARYAKGMEIMDSAMEYYRWRYTANY